MDPQSLYFLKVRRWSKQTLAVAQAFPEICLYWAMIAFAIALAASGTSGSTLGNVIFVTECALLSLAILALAAFFMDSDQIPVHNFLPVWQTNEQNESWYRHPFRLMRRILGRQKTSLPLWQHKSEHV
jgi:tellurite resistance protein TehA-like permease